MSLIGLTLVRTVLNTGYRMLYPFLPVIARGLGVEPEAVILAITARSGVGLTGPLLGSIGDLRGRRAAMLLGMTVFGLSMALVAVSPGYPVFFVALIVLGVSKVIFDPALQAYLGDTVDFDKRGTSFAVVELSWSIAYLLGVPAMGLLIAATVWQGPFAVLALLAVPAGLWLRSALPRDGGSSGNTLRGGLGAIRVRSSAIAGLTVSLFISAGNEVIGVVFGLWLEEAFALRVAALGLAAAVLGLAELLGESSVAAFADRLGKRTSVGAGIVLSAMAALALPSLGTTLTGALAGLFMFYLVFEFTIVSSLPLMSEQVPLARATLMATNVAAFSLGRSLGALAAAPLFEFGIRANSLAAVALNVLALIALLAFVRERAE